MSIKLEIKVKFLTLTIDFTQKNKKKYSIYLKR